MGRRIADVQKTTSIIMCYKYVLKMTSIGVGIIWWCAKSVILQNQTRILSPLFYEIKRARVVRKLNVANCLPTSVPVYHMGPETSNRSASPNRRDVREPTHTEGLGIWTDSVEGASRMESHGPDRLGVLQHGDGEVLRRWRWGVRILSPLVQ